MKFTALYSNTTTPVPALQKVDEATVHARIAEIRKTGDKRFITIVNAETGKIVGHSEP